MKTMLTLILLSAGLVLTERGYAEAPAAELKKFTGTWQAVSVFRDGREVQEEKVILTVKGEKYTLQTGKETVEGTHKLDPTRKPKTIDAVRTAGPDKGKTLLGIYELTNDTFKICVAAPGKDRPTEFASKPGSGTRLMVFKRQKP